MNIRIVSAVLSAAVLSGLSGCASSSYATPGRGANLMQLSADRASAQISRDVQTDGSLMPSIDKKPLAQFPAAIAVIRVQDQGYHSNTAETYGSGKFCVITMPDMEDPEALDRWQKMPNVAGISPINRLLLPQELNSDLEIREAAAKLHADMVLIYTIDTKFYSRDQLAPLSIVTLGLAPDNTTRVTSIVSAILMDTRNGYLYGTADATEENSGLTTGWTVDTDLENIRIKTEKAAFKKMTGQVEAMWGKVLKECAGKPVS